MKPANINNNNNNDNDTCIMEMGHVSMNGDLLRIKFNFAFSHKNNKRNLKCAT